MSVNNITKKRVTCSICGGENVLLDAYAAWSFEKQEWELQNTFQHAYCEDCDGETSWDGVPVEEPAPVIQITKGRTLNPNPNNETGTQKIL